MSSPFVTGASLGLSVLLASVAGAQQFTRDLTALPAQNLWTDGVSLSDVNNDGHLDILFANGQGYSSGGARAQHLYLNDGTGTFTTAHGQLNVANFNAKMVITEDFDNDGDEDALYAPEGQFPNPNQRPRLLINDGNGVFADESATRLPAIDMASFCVCAGDVDDDGDLDVVFTDGATFSGIASQAHLFLNDGNGHFTDATATSLPADLYNAQDVTLIDWDGDFDLDIALSGKGTAGKRSRLWLNDGTGNFTISTALDLLGSTGTYEIDWGDMDGDGALDGIVQSISGFAEGVGYNMGTSVINTIFGAPNGDDDNEMAGFDYDNDGDLDVVVGSLSGPREKFYRNDGGAFASDFAATQAIADPTLDLAIGDLDGDGDYDLVTGQGEFGDFTNKIYDNAGPADTHPPRILALETPSYSPSRTVFHAQTQDAVQDDGGSGWVEGSFFSWQATPAGVAIQDQAAFHQGGGSWRAEVPGLAGAGGAVLCWSFTDAAGNSTDAQVIVGTVPDFTDLGNGLAGTTGVPVLTGAGSPTPGGMISLQVTGAIPGRGGAYLLSPNPGFINALGGTIVPQPIFQFPYVTDVNGDAPALNLNWPSNLPACVVLYAQAFTLDDLTPAGLSFSNGLAAIQR